MASAGATVTIVPDVTRPVVVSTASANGTNVGVAFDERLDVTTAQEPGNYSIAGISPDAAVLRPDGKNVQLTFNGGVPREYTLDIADVHDVAGNALVATNLAGHVWLEDVADIGGPLPAGQHFTTKDGTIEIVAGGGDVWGDTGDQFTFAYTERTGDFDVIVRLDSLQYVGNSWSKAGLNVRSSIATNSQMIWFYPTPTEGANSFEGAIRTTDGGGFYDFGQPRPAAFYPAWLRLNRTGSAFTAYLSPNGTNWNVFGSTQNRPEFPATLLVGMGVVSHIQGTPTTAQFSQFGNLQPRVTFSETDSALVIRWDGSGVLESSDDLSNWNAVEGASSPYTATRDGDRRFYRVRRLFPQN
jgi:hypothetical protein